MKRSRNNNSNSMDRPHTLTLLRHTTAESESLIVADRIQR